MTVHPAAGPGCVFPRPSTRSHHSQAGPAHFRPCRCLLSWGLPGLAAYKDPQMLLFLEGPPGAGYDRTGSAFPSPTGKGQNPGPSGPGPRPLSWDPPTGVSSHMTRDPLPVPHGRWATRHRGAVSGRGKGLGTGAQSLPQLLQIPRRQCLFNLLSTQCWKNRCFRKDVPLSAEGKPVGTFNELAPDP